MNMKSVEQIPHYITYTVMVLCSILVVSLTGCDQIRELIAPDYNQTETLPQLDVFTWPNYVSDEIKLGFEGEFGVRVVVDTYTSNEELLAKLQVGPSDYDVIMPSDTVCILKSALHKAIAEQFINYLLRPEVNAKVTEATRFGTSVAETRNYLPEDLRNHPGIYPPEVVLRRSEFLIDLGDFTANYERAWIEVRQTE